MTNHRIEPKVPKLNPSKAHTCRLPPVSQSMPRSVRKREKKDAVIAFTRPEFVPGTKMEEMTSSIIVDLADIVVMSRRRSTEAKEESWNLRVFSTFAVRLVRD